jgi:hypothetical protein
MKSFVMACIAAVVIALGGWAVLDNVPDSSRAAYTSSGARI